MKRNAIPTLPATDTTSPGDKRVRDGAPKFIESLLNDTKAVPVFKNLGELRPEFLQPLGGGNEAAVYVLRSPKVQAVLKFGTKGIEAEAEALEAWCRSRVRAPRLLAQGIVPATRDSRAPIKYLVEEALLDGHGRLVETCADYLTRQPDKAREIGRLMGYELHKMHGTTTKRLFGDFADSPGSLSTYKSWNAFMISFLEHQAKVLEGIGITPAQLRAVRTYFKRCQFVKLGRYVHGDFSIRNAAVTNAEPLEVSLFDPNPMIGDPSWDIANQYNNHEFQKRRLAYGDSTRDLYVRDQQFLIGFRRGYKRRIRQDALAASRLIQASLQAEFAAKAAKSGKLDRTDVRVRREFIHELVAMMVRKAGRSSP